MTLQERYDLKRKEYMDNKITHEEFYLWLADAIKVTVSDLPVSLDRILMSTDPHLNDIPLHQWDRRNPIVRGKAVRAGMRAWSLCNTVCVLKAFAKRESLCSTK